MRADISFPLPLRTAYFVDAAASGAMGVLLLLTTGPLAPALGLPAALLRASGAVLVPFAALLAGLAARTDRAHGGATRALGWAVVVGNVLWTLASVVLVADVVTPTASGEAFVLAQAAAVAACAVLEATALRAIGRASLGRASLVGAR